ncbi:MAG TPA: prepilin-type N-terminal cleavage/methylation domain-containing protein [Candidatus Pacearchaeota archaeon]|nr:prepilin-type N-terminal cleavage/methylation domain-containing protein [Candidatus Pacearchaeota archaeon]
MNKNKSFTLIELLVVIVIIGILAGVIMISTSSSIDKANMAKGKVFSESVKDDLVLNLLSEWNLDEESGTTIHDSWENINNGTLTGGAWKTSENCVSESCLYLDSSGDYVLMPHNMTQNITDRLTMELWIKTFSNQTKLYPFIFGKHWRYYISIAQNSNRAVFYLSGINNIAMVEDLPFNKWIHVVGTYDKDVIVNNMRLYINGNLYQQITASGSMTTTTGNLYFGVADTSWTNDGYSGCIDEPKLYTAALSSSEIKQNYIAGLNSMLSSGTISKEEYNERINELAYDK